MYSPLKRYGAGTKAKDVGIVGIGGLVRDIPLSRLFMPLTPYACAQGHFGLLFAKALGANVTAISHSDRKKADAEKMGATRFIATHSGKEDDFKPYARSLDLIIATTNDSKMPIQGYLSEWRPSMQPKSEEPRRGSLKSRSQAFSAHTATSSSSALRRNPCLKSRPSL